MDFINNKYYIVRIGDFATNANTKIYYCLFTLLLCIEEYITYNIIDCFIILGISTLIWSLIEFLLHISNTRVIKPMNLYYMNKKKELPSYLGIFLQGFQEGGCITTFGLYFGDRINNYNYCIFLHALISIIIINVLIKENKQIHSSKRQINTKSSLFLMGSVTLYNIMTLYYNPLHFRRQLSMFFIMIYMCSFWTFVAWYKGFRKVEIYIKNTRSSKAELEDSQYIKKDYNAYDTFIVLAYDIIFEIGMAYLFFYNYYVIYIL